MKAVASRRSILVIEDAIDLAMGLVMNLQYEGYEAKCVHLGSVAIKEVKKNPPDLMVLDILLPDMGGLAVLEATRGTGYDGGVVVLSGLTTNWDQQVAYRLGANRYVTKPFDIADLMACIQDELTRSIAQQSSRQTNAIIDIDMHAHRIVVRGTEIHFTPIEFSLLAAIVSSSGSCVSKQLLLNTVWGVVQDIRTTTVETHIKTLRAKLKPFGLDLAIESVRKVGYRWNP